MTKEKDKIKILVAEDVESNYILVKNYLRDNIYELTWVTNGNEVVEHCKNNNYDLVLMDIKMPEMDGLEATKIIRETNKSLPIIALTAYALDSDKDLALEAGCNAFITKPFEKDELIQKIYNFIA